MLASRNYAPSPDLLPFVRRYYVFGADLPADHVLEDCLLAENAFVRILLKGDWAAETEEGVWRGAGKIVLFGGNSRSLRVRVKGPFLVAGFAVRPSAWRALFKESATEFVDKMVPLSTAWGERADKLLHQMEHAEDDAAMIACMEAAVREQLRDVGVQQVDKQIAQFEAIARTDSIIAMDDAAAQVGLSVRQLERRCLAAYGLSPKSILRRSRFLDLAEAMRGFSSPGDEILATLRFFDQSHLNREFRRFVGTTPGRFAKASTPLFTAGLKLRVEGKRIN